jgi:hypothetical protein
VSGEFGFFRLLNPKFRVLVEKKRSASLFSLFLVCWFRQDLFGRVPWCIAEHFCLRRILDVKAGRFVFV